MTEARLVLIDWGTSGRRVWLINNAGQTIDKRSDKIGMLSLRPGEFAQSLSEIIAGWPPRPVLMSGMVGARQGWCEAPYIDCPCDLAVLARSLHPVPDRGQTWIVPGLRYRDASGAIDVMRGEETQILGAQAKIDAVETVLLPGTHSKWVRVERRQVVGFRTYLTGELYDVLLNHSSIGRTSADVEPNAEAFIRGAALGETEGDLLGRLFAARAAVVGGDLPAKHVASFLSGILIAREVADALAHHRSDSPLALIGRPDLTEHYRTVLESRDVSLFALDGDVARDGLLAIARERGLI